MAWWLLACAVMVFAMVILGGATRLTESGLSMVEWKPLTLLPPMTDAQWQTEFQNYQQTPEYKLKNSWMTVADFKDIFRLEYIHRLWGRLIGVVFALPFLWFLYRRAVDKPLAWKLAGLFVLGGAQGALGWFMVVSGLQDRPDVSQYRLAAHLITAFILYACLIWVALDLFARGHYEVKSRIAPALSRLVLILIPAVLLVVTAGAFVAGLNAGLIYNTFPLMDGRVVPQGLFAMSPWYANVFENIMTVQFIHRVLAIALVIFVIAVWWRARNVALPQARNLAHGVLAMTFVQAALGIATLLFVVPLPLALAHQSGALILLTLVVCLAHALRAIPKDVPAPAPLHMKPAE